MFLTNKIKDAYLYLPLRQINNKANLDMHKYLIV